MPGPTPSADAPAGLRGPNSIAAVAASAPETTQTIVDIRLMLMPERRGGIRVRGRRADRQPVLGPVHEECERDDEHRDDDDHRELLPPDEHAADLPRAGERRRIRPHRA